MAQTPQQRRANAKFDKFNESKMGKHESTYKKSDKRKAPVGKIALLALVFVIIVPLAIEPLKLFWISLMGILSKFGVV